MLRLWSAVVFIALALALPAQQSTLLLAGARVLDPAGRELLERDVLVEGERIAKVAARGEIEAPDGVRRIDLDGLCLLPGLIDLHSHLLLRPYDQRSWNDQVLKDSLELRTIRATVAAKATVLAGFTTLRDLGTEGAAYADVALRDAIAGGLIPGPRVFAATRALVATGCYGPSGFDPRWAMPVGAQVADGPDGVRVAVRQQIAAGADWIKVYADYRRVAGEPATPTFSQAELDAIVDEATSARRPVAAHAVTDEAIRRAVRAGVRTIEHGYEASAETLSQMRRAGIVLCPTLAASEAIARYQGWELGLDQPVPLRVATSKAMFARALESGVEIACGSDVGVFAHGDNARELELMVEYGMDPARALRAATSVAARVLGREADLGSIAPGYLADLIAVRGEPLGDPAALRDPRLVVAGGRVVVLRR